MNSPDLNDNTVHAVNCTCGSMKFFIDEPTKLTHQTLSATCTCVKCDKNWVMKVELIPVMPVNTRDAGPSVFGGRTRGTDRDRH